MTNNDNYDTELITTVNNYDTGPCVGNHFQPSLIYSGKAGLGKAGALGKAGGFFSNCMREQSLTLK